MEINIDCQITSCDKEAKSCSRLFIASALVIAVSLAIAVYSSNKFITIWFAFLAGFNVWNLVEFYKLTKNFKKHKQNFESFKLQFRESDLSLH